MRCLWLSLALGGCFAPQVPEALDYKYDRVRVAAVRVWPLIASVDVPRTIDALVLAPHASDRPKVQVELCGYRTDLAVELRWPSDAACLGEPDLVETLDVAVPTTWQPDPVHFDACPDTPPYFSLPDSAEPMDLTCGTSPLVAVEAHLGQDRGAAVSVSPILVPGPLDTTRDLDLAGADPRLEVVDGELSGGDKVLLRFSMAAGWEASDYTESFPPVNWYFEAGTPYGTKVTSTAGFDEQGRSFAQNWLRIPAGYHGPLRVAAVRLDPVPMWAETTLEVP